MCALWRETALRPLAFCSVWTLSLWRCYAAIAASPGSRSIPRSWYDSNFGFNLGRILLRLMWCQLHTRSITLARNLGPNALLTLFAILFTTLNGTCISEKTELEDVKACRMYGPGCGLMCWLSLDEIRCMLKLDALCQSMPPQPLCAARRVFVACGRQ